MQQLDFVRPGALEWREVARPRIGAAAEALVEHDQKPVISRERAA